MKEKLISFFVERHLLTNLFFFIVFIGGIAAWNYSPKEELPDVTFDNFHIRVSYPGASAEEVEYYVTKPIEEAVSGVDGVYSITSTTGVASCSVNVEIDPAYSNKNEVITELRNAVLDVDLPSDIIDDPDMHVHKTSRSAIVDVALVYKGKTILDVKTREALQSYALSLEDKLLSLAEINSVERRGYLNDELQIKIDPEKLIQYEIPLNDVMNEIRSSNVRQPAGSIENIDESKVTIFGELGDIDSLRNLAIQGGFEGQVIRLSDVAEITKGYDKPGEVLKINGHEGLILNVVKNSRYGIIDAIKAVERAVDDFRENALSETKIDVVLLDDESIDVRNRLQLIKTNGFIGFSLILIFLFLFLDFRSGLWVALGIPFTFCFTMIAVFAMGYSINNITLAAVIIVMGMVVDDAIVVVENISRMRLTGVSDVVSAVKGTSYMMLPVMASILTTCVAFIPLFFFTGRFGLMVCFIPPIVFLMLGASLFEAIFILPGHMTLKIPGRIRKVLNSGLVLKLKAALYKKYKKTEKKDFYWFGRFEDIYAKSLEIVLKHRIALLIVFLALLSSALFIGTKKMKFVMFPDEETRQIRVTGETKEGTTRYETARLCQELEDVLLETKEVIGFRNQIARSRRGSAVQENKFRLRIEILPREKRKVSADKMISEWKEKLKDSKTLKKLKFSKTRSGQGSESPIEILVKENNNQARSQIAKELAEAMRNYPQLSNVEIDEPVYNLEYRIKLNRDKIRRLSINSSDIAKTLRASLEGTVLYELTDGSEPLYVRISVAEDAKNNLDEVLSIPVENSGNYLVPLRDIVIVEEVSIPSSIVRLDEKRTTTIYADIPKGAKKTPLEIADYFENEVFGKFKIKYPTAILEFAGEVKDTRESQDDFRVAVFMVVLLIYIILILLFNSLTKPLIIMLAIPFGVAGIIYAFLIHGIFLFGFFAVVGALGLAGVVVNDAIVMVVKLSDEYRHDPSVPRDERNKNIASIAKTRLRAVILTTVTTVAGIIPTAYGWAGYDSMLSQMMLALSWGLVFSTVITLYLVPCLFTLSTRKTLKP
ncbi:MAG: efflux RND transporter permease subunit [Candidatus Omnitrophota bacterium]